MSKTTILPDGSAFSTATILSREEAMALPPKDRPLCYRLPSKMYHDVWEAVGAASLCWEPKPTGVFDAEQASKFATELCFKLAEELERLGITYEQINSSPSVCSPQPELSSGQPPSSPVLPAL